MNVAQLRLKMNNFRAIGSADIVMDGITVMAGENGSGKSTISKVLCQAIRVNREFDELVQQELRRRLNPVVRELKGVVDDYSFYLGESHPAVQEALRPLTIMGGSLNKSDNVVFDLVGCMFDLVGRVEKLVRAGEEKDHKVYQEERLKRILSDILVLKGDVRSSGVSSSVAPVANREIRQFKNNRREYVGMDVVQFYNLFS